MPPPHQEIVWTVVVAAGSGTRFGGAKQFARIGGRRMLDLSVDVALASSSGVVLVVPEADVASESRPGLIVVAGGATRSQSVRAGLDAVPGEATIVCVHDAARPFATPALFADVVRAVSDGADAAVPAIAVTDTIKVVDAARRVLATPDRASLVAVQTPQAFRADVLRRAHADAVEGTDDAAVVEAVGGVVVVVEGATDNRKITHPDDLTWAQERAARTDAEVTR